MSHTSGPWKIVKYTDSRVIDQRRIVGPNGWIVDDVWGSTLDESEANLRLIAAAPELLEALELLLPVAQALRELRRWSRRITQFA